MNPATVSAPALTALTAFSTASIRVLNAIEGQGYRAPQFTAIDLREAAKLARQAADLLDSAATEVSGDGRGG